MLPLVDHDRPPVGANPKNHKLTTFQYDNVGTRRNYFVNTLLLKMVPMDAFEWDECFVTGVEKVEEQHHQLVKIMNRFGAVLMHSDGPAQAEVDRVFGELADYAKYHFQEEEAMMDGLGLDRRHVKKHCEEHAEFLQDVTRMHSATVQDDEEEAKRLLTYLTNWLAYHILGTDQTMALLISAFDHGKSQHDAFVSAHQNRDPATATLLRSMTTLFGQVTDSNRALLELNQTQEVRIAERTSELLKLSQQFETMALTMY